MAQLRTHKFVASLPAELEADAIYYVRTGAGFDQYVTNHSGTIVAYPVNTRKAVNTIINRNPSGISSVIESIDGSDKETSFIRTNGKITSVIETYRGKTKTTTLTRTNGNITSINVVET